MPKEENNGIMQLVCGRAEIGIQAVLPLDLMDLLNCYPWHHHSPVTGMK